MSLNDRLSLRKPPDGCNDDLKIAIGIVVVPPQRTDPSFISDAILWLQIDVVLLINYKIKFLSAPLGTVLFSVAIVSLINPYFCV